MRTPHRFVPSSIAPAVAAFAAFAVVGCAASGTRLALPKIQDSAGWQLSQGCRVYRLGIPTAPDCDILAGHGIAIQVTRIRLLPLSPGQDDRSTIGIELLADPGNWSFSAPYAVLSVAGTSHTPTDLDEAIAFAKGERTVLARLQPRQPGYPLTPGERRLCGRRATKRSDWRDGRAADRWLCSGKAAASTSLHLAFSRPAPGMAGGRGGVRDARAPSAATCEPARSPSGRRSCAA